MKIKPRNTWYMSAFTYGSPASVDVEKGVLQRVAVCSVGEALGHNVHLDSSFITKVVALGNAKKQGVKIRFGHPNMSGNALGTFLGRAKNFFVGEEEDKAYADVFLSNVAKEAPGGDLYTYVLELAKEAPDMFGMSIVFTPGLEYQKDDEGEKIIDEDLFEKNKKTFIEIEALHNTDFVDSPAANPDGVFSQFNENTMAAQVTEFLDTHPEVFRIVQEQPDIIQHFLQRYQHYLKTSNKGDAVDEVVYSLALASLGDDWEFTTDTHPQDTGSLELKVEEAALVAPIANCMEVVCEEGKLSLTEDSLPSIPQYNNLLLEAHDRAIEAFKFLCEEEGYEFAKDNYGKSEYEILKTKYDILKAGVDNTTTEHNEAEPVTFSEMGGSIDVLEVIEAKKVDGVSAVDAWKELIAESPDEYKKFINKGKNDGQQQLYG